MRQKTNISFPASMGPMTILATFLREEYHKGMGGEHHKKGMPILQQGMPF